MFDLAPTFGGCFARVGFEFVDGPVPGASLEILTGDQVSYENGLDWVIDIGTFEFYEPRQVRLTTLDGRAFDLEQGVRRLEDANGNTLSISEDGITHSSGKGVVFDRNTDGKIVSITIPAGRSMIYNYDSNGDLRI